MRVTYFHVLIALAIGALIMQVFPQNNDQPASGQSKPPAPLQTTPLGSSQKSLVDLIASRGNPYFKRGSTDEFLVLFDVKTGQDATMHTRGGIEISVVLDRSGSMAGPKLEQSKQTILNMIDQMLPTDRLHLVVYDHNVQTIFTDLSSQNPSRSEFIQRVRDIGFGGSTNLHAGLQQGIQALTSKNSEGRLKRVFLFSDGNLNAGETRQEVVYDLVRSALAQDVTVSSFGIGSDFNHQIMSGIAEVGRGDYHFIANSESINALVQKSLRGVTSLIGTSAELNLVGLNGAIVKKTYSYPTPHDRIRLSDIRESDNKRVMVALDTSHVQIGSGLNEVDLLRYELTYDRVRQPGHKGSHIGVVSAAVTEDAVLLEQHKDLPVLDVYVVKVAEERNAEAQAFIAEGRLEEAMHVKEEQLEYVSSKIPKERRRAYHRQAMKWHADSHHNMASASAAGPTADLAQVLKQEHYAGVLAASSSDFDFEVN